MTNQEIAKLILSIFIFAQLIAFLILYRFSKDKSYNSYFYALCFALIISGTGILTLEDKLFVAALDVSTYIIQGCCYIIFELISLLIVFISKKKQKNK